MSSNGTQNNRIHNLRSLFSMFSSDLAIDPGYVSVAEAIEYPTENGLTAHAFYYPPRNRDFVAPAGERPPLVVEMLSRPSRAPRTSSRSSASFWPIGSQPNFTAR